MNVPVTFTPWRSIREGAVGPRDGDQSFDDALSSPCSTCRTAPCCTHLPLHSFRVNNLVDLSYAAYLLNFDRIRLGLNHNGDWSVYYAYPCRFLNRETFGCTLHGLPEQPQVCVEYNPYSCFYKRSMTTMVQADFMLIDRSRLSYISQRTRFDDLRLIVDRPTWDELVDALEDISDDPLEGESEAEPPTFDAAIDEWRNAVLAESMTTATAEASATAAETAPASESAPASETATAAERVSVTISSKPAPESHRYDALRDPCTGCSAPCCETITFAQGTPATMSSLDFFRFCLGFPGVELFVTDQGWWLTVKSTCRHLQHGRCAIYGQKERPLQCRYYDAWKCTVRDEYTQARPSNGMRVRIEHFPALVEVISFDRAGTVTEIPPLSELRANVESRWRSDLSAADR